MEFISKTSHAQECYKTVEALTSSISDSYDLGFLFISSLNKVTAEEILVLLKKRIKVRQFIGCSCAGVIGSEKEIERTPATVLILTKIPEAKFIPFSMQQSELDILNSGTGS